MILLNLIISFALNFQKLPNVREVGWVVPDLWYELSNHVKNSMSFKKQSDQTRIPTKRQSRE